MDHDTTTTLPAGRGRRARRFFRWGIRRLSGPLVLTGALFGLIYASAGTDTANIDDAQPIDYYEECDREGCSSEEVKELWSTFHHECFVEGCWMEEVAENAGSGVAQDPSYGNWYYTNPGAVGRMLDYFVNRLGHREALDVTVRPGLTDTFFDNLIRTILQRGVTISVTCREQAGGGYDCLP